MNTICKDSLDPGIAHEVKTLRANGVETFESCQGGQGHPYPEPTIRFHGGQAEGPRAVGVALQNGLRLTQLRRVWVVVDGELNGPVWEMTFITALGGGAKAVEKSSDGTVTWEWH